MNTRESNKEAVLDFLKKETSKPVSLNEITRALHIGKQESRSLRKVLRSLTRSGDIFRTKKGYYGLVNRMNLLTGTFEAHRDGYGFVVPDASGRQDIFIPPRRTMGSMSGDRVVARIENPLKREGTIVNILERGQRKIIGQLVREGNIYYVKPKRKNIPFYILISPPDRGKAMPGENVTVEITSYPTASTPPSGKVVNVLKDITTPDIEIDMIIEEYSLHRKFPSSVITESKNLSEKTSLKKRVDCRDLLTVTVDGETAKDFDDAISISRTNDGYRLYVHISDVGHYVAWDSALDIEAGKRGTSVYFPGRVIPMLPHQLSSNLCSLLPKKERLTFTAELVFDRDGAVIKKEFYPSVILSNERMTYTSVRKILVDKNPDEREKYGYLLESLEIMEELCGILRSNRIKRGSLDFDLPEPEILLDIQGRPEAIIRAERNLAHMIIEEFMIAANEAVASFLEGKGVPSIYRVHEKPDTSKIEELIPIFNAFGMNIKKTGPDMFHSVLKKTKGIAGESLLNILLLRSLKQARYATENTGHFGLASESYTHFTSPIRRYPDLIVHRILRNCLGRKGLSDRMVKHLEAVLPDIAAHSSKTERTADEAERETVNAMRAWFMKDRVGDEYAGIVSNITSNGMKIQLKDFFVEGFLHLSSLHDDYYRFNEKSYSLSGRRTKKTFEIGQEVIVRIDRVNVEEREIVFGLV